MDTEVKRRPGRPPGSTNKTERVTDSSKTKALYLVDQVTELLGNRDIPQRVQRRKASKKASLLIREKGLADASLEEQLIATSEMFARQVFETSLVLANTRCPEIEADVLSAAVFDVRLKYVKEFLGIAQKLQALAKQHRDNTKEEATIVSSWKSEADGLLAEANAMLAEVR